ncbi:FAD-dependent oxidoreductase [Phormidium sp. CLA17]|uniref:FAD-dependent oxidoreductase n=1 Tax=Leptolyngbya sp. Cla-17 TaxID=2803751 RepID=UPI0014927F44|nr:FAD-dependent oxidoreductase [Leptolyngbya sp. Cla-17]MBM0742883.1 FAD-dependent oxidoreductase [Leptolyngbya sp. Cla-17]
MLNFAVSCQFWHRALLLNALATLFVIGTPDLVNAQPRSLQQTSEPTADCELLIVGAGFAGTAAAHEGLLAGRTVCLTDITDWVGGQVSSQGTSALDEAKRMREQRFFPRGYNEFRDRIVKKYGSLSSGNCWVSVSCFLPSDGHQILWTMLQDAAKKGKGTLKWFPNTVIKELEYSPDGRQISSAIALQHTPAPNTPPLNTEPLSQLLEDIYRPEDSDRLKKQQIRFTPPSISRTLAADGSAKVTDLTPGISPPPARWYIMEATETGEIIALADVPYRLGLDPVSHIDPSSPVKNNDAYCTQGFTYTFVMERTATPQTQSEPPFYPQYAPYFSYENSNNVGIDAVFTYRRIWSPDFQKRPKATRFGVAAVLPGDLSMQNWTWGNDYRPGTEQDNLIYSREQLQQRGELSPGRWMGGLRTETLRRGEENAIAYYYWLVAGTTDSQLGDGVKQSAPNHRYVMGLASPIGTAHGLSKYPYIREARRIIGRPTFTYPNGFAMHEIDVSQTNYGDEAHYKQTLPPEMYRKLRKSLAGLEFLKLPADVDPDQIPRRTRSTIYPDSVGIAQYAMDFHPCMAEAPPEKLGNEERPGVRQAHGPAYPGQIALRAMIPQKIDNLIIGGKSIANSTIAAAAYRVHPFEWSVGAAAAVTADFALRESILPYQLVDDLPRREPLLEKLRSRLEANSNPTAFPNTSIFNLNWEEWK